ncbi:hypothetical protein UPYG_G00260600 [Umbra pygmaea]|uniref:Zona pellucida sperm-binding protein 3 n=1 Tax=Umbra pygmaea TaxID=75934 RepID=A0ABD0W9B0_UMBPY
MESRQELGMRLAVLAAFVCFWNAALSSPWTHPHASLKGSGIKDDRKDLVFQSKPVLKQTMTWTFPQDPVPDGKPRMKNFELKQPVPANTVGVRCGENRIQVEVKQDLFGNGQTIQPEDLTLGGCVAVGVDVEDQRLNFESDLQGCNSKLKMSEDFLVYAFNLLYRPSNTGDTPVTRTNEAVVDIECYYMRKQNVSSDALRPTLLSFTNSQVAEEQLYFYLRLMTDDWQFDRKSSEYFLGDQIHIEATVLPYHHVPLRVFVDNCFASLVPDMNAEPRYSFIENYGCLVDAVLTDSKSRFLPRSQEHKLQIQLEAFRFKQQTVVSGSNRKAGQGDTEQIYITCHLKATSTSNPIDALNKACSYISGSVHRWRAADGDDGVCGCCDSSCTIRRAREISIDSGEEWVADAVLGPISIQDQRDLPEK